MKSTSHNICILNLINKNRSKYTFAVSLIIGRMHLTKWFREMRCSKTVIVIWFIHLKNTHKRVKLLPKVKRIKQRICGFPQIITTRRLATFKPAY